MRTLTNGFHYKLAPKRAASYMGKKMMIRGFFVSDKNECQHAAAQQGGGINV
jgi:hypothetical protein